MAKEQKSKSGNYALMLIIIIGGFFYFNAPTEKEKKAYEKQYQQKKKLENDAIKIAMSEKCKNIIEIRTIPNMKTNKNDKLLLCKSNGAYLIKYKINNYNKKDWYIDKHITDTNEIGYMLNISN